MALRTAPDELTAIASWHFHHFQLILCILLSRPRPPLRQSALTPRGRSLILEWHRLPAWANVFLQRSSQNPSPTGSRINISYSRRVSTVVELWIVVGILVFGKSASQLSASSAGLCTEFCSMYWESFVRDYNSFKRLKECRFIDSIGEDYMHRGSGNVFSPDASLPFFSWAVFCIFFSIIKHILCLWQKYNGQ